MPMRPVIYENRLVAIAGEHECHVVDLELNDEEICIVLLMCLYVGFADDADLVGGEALSRRAEQWAATAWRTFGSGGGGSPRD